MAGAAAEPSERSGTTIVAVASPPGGAPRAVLRISGPAARKIIARTCRVPGGDGALALDRRGAFEARFDDGAGSLPVRVLWFPAPRSFTREDVAELHLPGAPPLVERALERLLGAGATLAQRGEFTRRAFANGRIDLTRAEGVLALVEATNQAERRAATALLFGGLERRMTGIRESVDGVRALVEASLDFDESDTGHVPEDELDAGLALADERLSEARAWEVRRTARAASARVVLVGAPNAGKSALFNALAVRGPDGEALVADLAGTTRDAKEALFDLERHAPALASARVVLVDTAGVEDGGSRALDGAELRAQEFARGEREAADLRLIVVDGAAGDSRSNERPEWAASGRVVAWNKSDLRAASEPPAEWHGAPVVATSAETGEGLRELAAAIADALGLRARAGAPTHADTGSASGLREDARQAIDEARRRVGDARSGLAAGLPLDLVAEALREATSALDRVVGRTTPEDLLDRIFARFCLGK